MIDWFPLWRGRGLLASPGRLCPSVMMSCALCLQSVNIGAGWSDGLRTGVLTRNSREMGNKHPSVFHIFACTTVSRDITKGCHGCWRSQWSVWSVGRLGSFSSRPVQSLKKKKRKKNFGRCGRAHFYEETSTEHLIRSCTQRAKYVLKKICRFM